MIVFNMCHGEKIVEKYFFNIPSQIETRFQNLRGADFPFGQAIKGREELNLVINNTPVFRQNHILMNGLVNSIEWGYFHILEDSNPGTVKEIPQHKCFLKERAET